MTSSEEIKQVAEKVIPEAVVTLDGVPHTIKCSFGVLIRYQRLSGKDALKKETFRDMKIEDYINLMAACLYATKEDPPEAHIDEVTEKMGGASFLELAMVVAKIFRNAAPDVLKEEKKILPTDPTDPTAPTTSTSPTPTQN